MSIAKTKIDQNLVISYLQKYFDVTIKDIVFISGGESSQAFSFHGKGSGFVVRVNTNDRGFRKDRYAFEHFASGQIPIPKIVHIGTADGYSFAISTMALGMTIKNLPHDQLTAVLPKIITTLDIIHGTDVSLQKGFGKWNTEGIGEFNSWKEFILAVGTHLDSGKLFETTFLEREVWDQVYGKIEHLVSFCPEEKFLVHGDYGFDNLVSDGENITGVLDWAESMYGDFVFDVAWLGFWARDKSELYEKHYREMNISNFEERLLCYKLRIGLSSLSFYAYSQQKNKYNAVKGRLLKFFSEA